MCLKHNKYHIQMRLCNVQGTPKNVRQNSENSFQNRPKIHSKSLPEALQNRPQKKHATKTPKNQKKCRKWSPKGESQGVPRMWFSDMLGLLGPPGGQNGSQTSPQGPPEPSGPSFLWILGQFLVDFLRIFGGFLLRCLAEMCHASSQFPEIF